MRFISNRKWRQYYRRISLRASFSIVLIVVLLNSCMYFAWQRYQRTSVIGNMVTGNIIDHNAETDNYDDTNVTVTWQYQSRSSVRYKYSSSSANVSTRPCPSMSTKLIGRFVPDLAVHNWSTLAALHSQLDSGHWSPACYSAQQVAVIIPYRNRESHLQVLVNNLHTMLARQDIYYGIFVVEQLPSANFNRAILFNIGFVEALKWHNFNCFVFHDVDLIPENDRNLYKCGSNPKHLSAYIDKFSYKLPYQDLFGGVSAISVDQFRHVNGFSNLYFGWGGEDDDMSKRLRHHGYQIYRYPTMIGSYRMIKHVNDNGNDANKWRFALVRSAAQRMHKDGLHNLEYQMHEIRPSSLMVWLKVTVDEEKIKSNYSNYINQTFFDTSLDYQIKIVAIMSLFFVVTLVCICILVACTANVAPDSSQTLKTNRVSSNLSSDKRDIR